MAGILDEVMDGITAKEKGASQTPPPPAAQTPPPPTQTNEQTPPQAPEKKGIFDYGEAFTKRYGDPKKPA
jgi:hypothetical protein